MECMPRKFDRCSGNGFLCINTFTQEGFQIDARKLLKLDKQKFNSNASTKLNLELKPAWSKNLKTLTSERPVSVITIFTILNAAVMVGDAERS